MSISPDQFLTQPSDPDEETPDLTGTFEETGWGPLRFSTDRLVLQPGPNHLESIAASLSTIAASFGANAELEDERNTLREETADLHDKYAALFGLVADIEKLVAKSTSKLALSVKDAINGWKTGVAVEENHLHAEPLAPEIVAASGLSVSTYIDGDVDPIEEIVSPAHDAPVEEWRDFARTFDLPNGINLEQMNRSQIRSVLGMAQTVAAEPSDG